MANYRIWWQSSMREGGFPAYAQLVQAHARKFLSPEFELEFHGLPRSVNDQSWLSIRLLNEREVMGNILQARAGRYDAFTYGCFADPAIREARELLEVPVFGMFQTALHWAQYYGTRPAILHYSENFYTKDLPRLLANYGMDGALVPTPAFHISVEQLNNGLEDPQPVIDLALDAAKEAIARGADLIIPGCGILNLILANNGVSSVPGTGVTVMDVTALMMKVTEAGILLREKAGLVRSDYGFYSKPKDALVQEALETYF